MNGSSSWEFVFFRKVVYVTFILMREILWHIFNLLVVYVAAICKSNKQKDMSNAPEIFWINMDKSLHRREVLGAHLNALGHLNRRVRGVGLQNIYIPEDIRSTWDKANAKIQSDFQFSSINIDGNFSHVMLGLVGRTKKNKLKEIGCTSSHLEAMRQAIYENRSSSRYAVITEDDIYIPFNIDFDALAASAPKDFGILQLFDSNEESMNSLWNGYTKKKSRQLWTESYQKQAAAFWSTCAYLIDREVLRPIIDKIAYKDSTSGFVNLKIIAGIKKPCRPKLTSCCEYQNATMSFNFLGVAPCIWAAKGFQADSFIYALAKTYVLHVPLITNGAGGNESTFHQDHVLDIHQSAFARQRLYINELIEGKVPLPTFATLSCSQQQPLPIQSGRNTEKAISEVVVATTQPRRQCKHVDVRNHNGSVAIYWISSYHSSISNQINNASLFETTLLDQQQYQQQLHYFDSIAGRTYHKIGAATATTVQSTVESSQRNHPLLYIPEDVMAHWNGRRCLYQTAAATTITTEATTKPTIDTATRTTFSPYLHANTLSTTTTAAVSTNRSQHTAAAVLNPSDAAAVASSSTTTTTTTAAGPNILSQQHAPFVSITGLCGRGKGQNHPYVDLPLTVTHLAAIYEATYYYRNNNTSSSYTLNTYKDSSPYALILEGEDIQLAFDVDIEALAASAPKGFGILRLHTSNIESMSDQYERYSRNSAGGGSNSGSAAALWSRNVEYSKQQYNEDAGSTMAYLINREVLKPIIQSIVTTTTAERGGGGISTVSKEASIANKDKTQQRHMHRRSYDMKIIAGLQSPCIPAECCNNLDRRFQSSLSSGGKMACVDSSSTGGGFRAQKFLWNLADTFILNIPLFTTRNHVSTLPSTSRRNQIIDELSGGIVPLPAFIRPCS